DPLAPRSCRQGTLDKTLAQGSGLHCRGIAALPGVIAEETELPAVELAQPAADVELPHGMIAEILADDAHPDRLPRSRGRRQRRSGVAFADDLARRRTVTRLEVAVVVSLIGEEKGLVRADPPGQAGGRFRSIELPAQLVQMGLISSASLGDL